MSLTELGNQIKDLATSNKVDYGPFLEILDRLISEMDELVSGIADPKAKELMVQGMSDVRKSRSEFVNIFPAEVEKMHAEIVSSAEQTAAALSDFEKTHAESVALIDELEATVPTRMEAARVEMLALLPELPPPPEPIAINPGEELVARLLELGAPAKPASKTMPSPGNIWENWKQGPGKT